MRDRRGPTYQETAERLFGLRTAHPISIGLKVVPPTKRADGRGWSAWVLCLSVGVPQDASVGSWDAQETFGHNGAWDSFPQALAALALRLEMDLLAGIWPKPKGPTA